METPKYTLFSNRDLVRLVIPMIIEQMLFVSVGMIDTMMISSQGDASVSGVSLVDMVNNFIGNIYFALATGGAVVAAQFLGAKKEADARSSARQLLVLNLVFGMLLTLGCELGNRHLLRLVFGNLPPDVLHEAVAYFRVTACTYPVIAVYCSCTSLLRAMKCSQWSMYSSTVTNVLNVIGNYIFIFVLKQGVAGAATATLLSRIAAMAMVLCILSQRTRPVYVDWHEPFHIHWGLVRRILFIGVPNGIESGLFQLGRVLVVGLIAGYGTVQIAANAVGNNIGGLTILCGIGFGLAMITVVGQSVGAGDEGQCRFYIRKMMRWAYVVCAVNALIVLAVMPLLLKCYGKLTPEVLNLGGTLACIHLGFGVLLWPASFVFPNALRAANDVKFTMIVSIVSMFAVRIGCSYLLAAIFHTGALAVWSAMIADWVVRVTCFVWRYRSGGWKRRAQFTS